MTEKEDEQQEVNVKMANRLHSKSKRQKITVASIAQIRSDVDLIVVE